MTHTPANLKGKNLAEIFDVGGFLTKDQTDQLSAEARASGLRIADAALEFGFISEEKLVQALSLQSGFPAMTP
ncbi:type II secretion system protein E, partial [mine drainage metagenome]